MNALKNLSLILLLSLAFTGCHNKSSKINDFNLLLYAPEYASGFDIKGAGGKESVLITVRNPWQGADSVTTWLFIVRNGEEVPEGFAGQVLKGDAKRIVAMSSTHIAMLDAIGEVRCITGVSGIDYISNPDIQARRDSIGDVGYEGTSTTSCCSRSIRPRSALWGERRKRNGKQTRRTRHTVHVCRRLS